MVTTLQRQSTVAVILLSKNISWMQLERTIHYYCKRMMTVSTLTHYFYYYHNLIVVLLFLHCIVCSTGRAIPCDGLCLKNNNDDSDGELLPDPSLMVSGKTCAEWQKKASDAFLPLSHCESFKATIGAACGCKDPPKSVCNVCPHGYKWGSKITYDDGSEETCEGALFWMSTSSDICEYYAEQYSQVCCSSDTCTLCPSSSSFSADTQIKYQNNDLSFTCGDALLQASLLYEGSDDCIQLQSIVQDQCHCQPQQQQQQQRMMCTLCPNGKKPQWENGIIIGKHNSPMTCLEAQDKLISKIPADSNDCLEAHAEGIYYCGCDLSPSGCTLCTHNYRVPESLRHEKLIDPNGHTVTCAEYESFLNTQLPTSQQCHESKMFQSICCSNNNHISHLRKR